MKTKTVDEMGMCYEVIGYFDVFIGKDVFPRDKYIIQNDYRIIFVEAHAQQCKTNLPGDGL